MKADFVVPPGIDEQTVSRAIEIGLNAAEAMLNATWWCAVYCAFENEYKIELKVRAL